MLDGSEAAAKFVDTIIDAKLNGTVIEPEVRKTLHRNLMQRLEARITTAIIEQLDTQQQLELEHLVDSDQIDKIEGYLEKHGLDLNRTLASVMTEFQASYLGA